MDSQRICTLPQVWNYKVGETVSQIEIIVLILCILQGLVACLVIYGVIREGFSECKAKVKAVGKKPEECEKCGVKQ